MVIQCAELFLCSSEHVSTPEWSTRYNLWCVQWAQNNRTTIAAQNLENYFIDQLFSANWRKENRISLGLREFTLRNRHFHKHTVQMMRTHAIRGVLGDQDTGNPNFQLDFSELETSQKILYLAHFIRARSFRERILNTSAREIPFMPQLGYLVGSVHQCRRRSALSVGLSPASRSRLTWAFQLELVLYYSSRY